MTRNQEIDIRKSDDLQQAVITADMILNKTYFNNLNKAPIANIVFSVPDIEELNNCVRFFDVTQIVLNKKENMRDKLVTVFNAVGSAGASLLMLIHGDERSVSIKFGVKSNNKNAIGSYSEVLQSSLKGNFPGTKIKRLFKKDLDKDILSAFPKTCSVASVTDVSGERSEEESKDRQFVQGIEKLIDTMQGKKYTMLLIADPVSLTDLNVSRKALEDLYSAMIPFAGSQMTFGTSDTESISSSISHGTTKTINHSVANSVNHTTGTNSSTSVTTGVTAGGKIGPVYVGGFSSVSKTVGKTESDTVGKTVTDGTSDGTSDTNTEGKQVGKGTSQSLQISFENHTIKQLLKKIDKTLERYDVCGDVGMWNCAMYCIAENSYDAQMAANVYHSIIRGKNSSLENGGVTVWEDNKANCIINSLKMMKHPLVNINNLQVTPGTLISSSELAIQAGLPNHSVPGVPVIECAEFGRVVSHYSNNKITSKNNYSIDLGSIWHMNQEEKLPVILNPDNLASHSFITGSTGSGKSNTVYQILSDIRKFAKFLVIEPAKGEYKNVFGNNVKVYGTNPSLTPLLRINPFSFPSSIHILEHLDRLIEIFNVCWPMYAAMPAVLKEAVEKSYEDCGWNLAESTNEYNCNYYPTFADVTRNIRTIIDSSEYDAENKGAYKGSLITRLKSLTNGINGLIFTTDEISNRELFDENVIVDLSRVGSTETKSLIMGLLVLKLQEYRMTSGKMNDSLRHVTVLEEAHNLLKRTSTEQSQDSGNLLGKSVEMLTNAIAEMRTYGEGFIIADQAPALLDMAVIRNTNTKIIMRLPDQDDRELVGKAASLNDDQIVELSKLPCGVAAVYQNEWIEPVLCKVAKYDFKEEPYRNPQPKDDYEIDNESRLEVAKLLCTGTAITGKSEEKDLKDKLNELSIKDSSKVWILKSVKASLASPRYTKLAPVISELFPELKAEFITSFNRTSDPMQWTDDVDAAIRQLLQQDIEENLLRSIRQSIVTDYLYNELHKADLLEKWAATGGVK